MDFNQAFTKCLRNYATFSGRAQRSEYWYFVLFLIIGHMCMHAIDRGVFGTAANEAARHIIDTLFSILMLVPGLAVAVRRLHDVNRSGWWLLMYLTIIGIIYPILVWKCSKGTTGSNRFGPDPLSGTGL